MNNNDYFKKKWLLIILFSLPVLYWILYDFSHESFSDIIGNVLTIFLVIGMLFIIRRTFRKEIERNLKSSLPADIIKLLNAPVNKYKGDAQLKETMIGYNAAFGNLLYGNKEEAYRIIEQVDWENKISYYQSMKNIIFTLGNYLFEEDNFEGLAAARRAKALATTSERFPGTKKATEGFEAYVEIGQILNGYLSSEILNQLGEKLKSNKKRPLFQLIIAWGLANAYVQLDEEEKAEEMLLFCKTKAPHCEVLHKVKKKFEVISSIANF